MNEGEVQECKQTVKDKRLDATIADYLRSCLRRKRFI